MYYHYYYYYYHYHYYHWYHYLVLDRGGPLQIPTGDHLCKPPGLS